MVGLKTGAWLFASGSLYFLSQVQGWERGVPIWLGLFTAFGIASLLAAALAPDRYWMTAVGASIGLVLSGLSLVWGQLI
ncbi:MAG: hypothetical protein AAGD96_30170 [Chloroflexota bacterium]